MFNNDQVVLVDLNDNQIGITDKLAAHINGFLHRAVSVFIINSSGEWLLQQRADGKYHSSGLWTNTACTHPYPGESNLNAAQRRLYEEMGLKVNLIEAFTFIYNERLNNNLIENEFDHVFIGVSDDMPSININEVKAFRYIKFEELEKEINDNPENFTVWFKKIYKEVNEHIKSLLY